MISSAEFQIVLSTRSWFLAYSYQHNILFQREVTNPRVILVSTVFRALNYYNTFKLLTRFKLHLHNRVKGHKQQSSAIAKHFKNMHGTMPQGLLERFKVLKKCKNKFDRLRNAFYKIVKAKSQRASRLHSCESIFIVFLKIFTIFAPSYVNSSRQNRLKCCNLDDLFSYFP